MTDVLAIASRKRIFDYVSEEPGCHLREVGRKCNVPLGTALYHLDRLESEGLITVRRDGRYKRYFASNGTGRREKDFISALRRDVPRRMAELLLGATSLTQRELCEKLEISRSTVSFHTNSLVSKGIIRREPARPENKYVLEDAELTRSVLKCMNPA